jgi:hypothetical protein
MASRYGQGTVYYDKKKRRWVGTIEVGTDADGRRIRKKATAKTKPEVLIALRDLSVERDKGTLVTGKAMTTGEWLSWWLDNVVPGNVALRTEEQFGQVVKDWIKPYIGTVVLEKLRPEDVVAMMRALEKKGLSPTTQAKARTILRRSLTHAERFGRVSRNVAALTDAPRHSEAKLDDALDTTDAAAVLAAAKGDRLEALAVLVLAVGLRQGEGARPHLAGPGLREETPDGSWNQDQGVGAQGDPPPVRHRRFAPASHRAARGTNSGEDMGRQ